MTIVSDERVSDERLSIGGLMRCCVETWDEAMRTARGWQDGDTLQCKYTTSEYHRMVREDGLWSWSFPKEEA
jgi:hypothetical protein